LAVVPARCTFEAVVQQATGLLGQQLTLKWWNMPFMSRVAGRGQELIVYGVIKDSKGRLSMSIRSMRSSKAVRMTMRSRFTPGASRRSTA
jgi:hypothetical protein